METTVFKFCAFYSSARLGTEFLHRFCAGNGRIDSEYLPTVFDNYTVNCFIDDVPQNISLSEIAGQADYRRLRVLSYPGTDVFVCLFNVCQPQELKLFLTEDLPEMLQHQPQAKIVMVGCYPELRDKMFYEQHHTIDQLLEPSTSRAEHPYLTPGMVHESIKRFCIDSNLPQPYADKICYVEYSSRYSTGLKEVIEIGCRMSLKDKKKSKKAPESKGFSFTSVFRGMIGGEKKKPVSSAPLSAGSDADLNLDERIVRLLDYWCGPVDDELKSKQLELIRSKQTMGILAGAFTLLRLLFRLHSDRITTATVVYEYIIPSTKAGKCPFYFYLLGRRDASHQPIVYSATHFLSHAWNCYFSLLEVGAAESSLYAYYNIQPYGKACYYWCDVFIKNQHFQAPSDEEFISAIFNAQGGTVAIFDRIESPLPLTRIWCLFEYYQSVKLFRPLRFYLPSGEDQINQQVQVNIRNSQATVPADKERILAEIEQTIGIDELNEKLKETVLKGLEIAESETRYRNDYNDRTRMLLGDTSDILP